MKEVVYEVWGEDTFAREEYLVGVYEDAKKEKEQKHIKHRRRVKRHG